MRRFGKRLGRLVVVVAVVLGLAFAAMNWTGLYRVTILNRSGEDVDAVLVEFGVRRIRLGAIQDGEGDSCWIASASGADMILRYVDSRGAPIENDLEVYCMDRYEYGRVDVVLLPGGQLLLNNDR